jgi:5-hydroxyisourate hydrolase
MITTQVVDTSRGKPAASVPVELDFFITGHGWRQVGQGSTDENGFVRDFQEPSAAGIYRLAFDIAQYDAECMFPSISVTFEVQDPAAGCHLPLVLNAYGYSTFRANGAA